jgi:hypothetical protein
LARRPCFSMHFSRLVLISKRQRAVERHRILFITWPLVFIA